MKSFKIKLRPLVVIVSFLLIIISGEETGGFYFSYLSRALPHGTLYAILATTGIFMLLLTIIKPVWNKTLLRSILNQTGGLLLLMSVYVFFCR